MSHGAGSGGSRAAGLLVPLFSLRSTRGWGIGEIGDLGPFAAWAASAGHRVVQLLPVFELPAGERSPYSALSTFALDPIYVTLPALEDHEAAGGEAALPPETRRLLDEVRAADALDYAGVRRVKEVALGMAWDRFREHEEATGSTRAATFRRFREAESAWLRDYAIFRAARERWGPDWQRWPEPLRRKRPHASGADPPRVAFHEWVQWVAAGQWAAARRAAAAAGVRLKGDLPFMVAIESADVWARPAEFDRRRRLGAPPDAFNAAGQDWGLPIPRWGAMATGDFAWLRARAARAAELFDLFRIDHVVGFYRAWALATGRVGCFLPASETAQRAQGERLLGVLRAAARPTEVVGEDLGAVPDWVRASLTTLDVPGYRVLRWEHDAGRFRDPAGWPVRSVATSGTHDTTALATWWEDELDDTGRRALAAVPLFAGLATAARDFTLEVQSTLLDGLYAAASELVVLPFEDAHGGRVRVNTPATVGPLNWSYRLPWTLEELAGPSGATLTARLAALAGHHRRAG